MQEDLKEIIAKSKNVASHNYERRLFLILGFQVEHILPIINDFLDENSIIISDDERLTKLFETGIKIQHKDTKNILGKTFSNTVIDLRFYPDVISLSRGVETVKGGGLIFLFLPFRYSDVQERYIKKLKPIGINAKPRDILRRRLLLKALKNAGIYVYSTKNKRIVKKSEEILKERPTYKLTIPNNITFNKEIYNLCATNDQVNVLKNFEKMFYDQTSTILITADRGRGKSASIGLALVAYAHAHYEKKNKKLRIIVTAPDFMNSMEIFNFTKKALDAIGIPYKYAEQTIDSEILRLTFIDPYEAIFYDTDLLVVDEAAGLQFPILKKIVEKSVKTVFSTTLHGYEGSGRMFSVRFIPLLQSTRNDFIKVELNMPIRYAPNDPIEKWLFDSLMLDAEPPILSEEDKQKIILSLDDIKFVKIDPFSFIVGNNESLMKETFGILISAHYRNNPNDLLMFADAPHYFGYVGLFRGKPVVAIELGMEGGLSDEDIQVFLKEAPSGHIIPDKIIKYYGLLDLGKKHGWRVIRITVHPDVMLKGIGSFTLKFIEEEAKTTVYWIGAGFTSYPELLSFWIKNGYIPIHLSPKRNRTTGEHTILVIKPLSEDIDENIRDIVSDFKLRLLKELSTTYKNLSPTTAWLILKHTPPIHRYHLKLSPQQAFRLKLYINDVLHFESASDAVEEIVRYYFGKNYNLLEKSEELLLIEGILQRRKVGIRNLLNIRRYIRKIWFNIIKVDFQSSA